MKRLFLLAVAGGVLASLLSGCSSTLTVTQVPVEKPSSAKGVTYYLPKPFLVTTPQADGTVNFDVIYMPDKSREYAIQPSSSLSAYTFQISRDEKGLLNQVEYKADTSLVGQQLASSAGTAAAQWYNMDASKLAAGQTQINAAQTALDSANSTVQAASAALAADQANQPTNLSIIAADRNALAQAQAKLPTAEQALQRAKTSTQAVATTASSGTPGTQTGPTIGSYFQQPAWNPPYTTQLPQRFGPVLYAINDTGEGASESVSLRAVVSTIPGTDVLNTNVNKKVLGYRVNANAQPIFETYQAAKPVLMPSIQTIDANTASLYFKFSIPIAKTPDVLISTDTFQQTSIDQTNYGAELGPDGTILKVTLINKLRPGSYIMTVRFSYAATIGSTDHALSSFTDAEQKVRFTIQKDSVPVLSPSNQTVPTSASSVYFVFNQPIAKLVDVKLSLDGDSPKPQPSTPSLAANNTVLNLGVQNLTSGSYTVVVSFQYNLSNGGGTAQAEQTVKFTAK
jgi:hypothetical protein